MKIYLTLFICLSTIGIVNSQPTKQLKIGDRIPNLALHGMINYPTESVRMPDFKGKFLILDFWHTGCLSCIEAMPAMEELQKEFYPRLKIIAVNFQSTKIVRQFILKQRQVLGRQITLTIASNDKLLNKLFKPPTYPHYVWIDSKGVVKYITFGSDVTAEHIESFIQNIPLAMEEKNDEYLVYQIDQPVFINGNGGNESTTRACSILSKSKIKMAATSSYYHPGEKNSYINAIGWPIKALFQNAYTDFLNGYHIPDNRTILRVQDTSKYVWDIRGALQWDNFYAYQLFVPYQSAESLKKMMQNDLMRYFNLESHMEKRVIKCWVIRAEDTSLIVTRGGELRNEMSSLNFNLNLRNVKDSIFMTRLIYNLFYESPYPFIYDIHMKSNIDISLENINMQDLNAVIAAFKSKYKLDIQPEDHEVDILVITEQGYKL